MAELPGEKMEISFPPFHFLWLGKKTSQVTEECTVGQKTARIGIRPEARGEGKTILATLLRSSSYEGQVNDHTDRREISL
jgi:hypothetical protein